MPHVMSLLILFARVGTMAMMLPAFSDDAIPARIRVLFGVGLAIGFHAPMAAVVQPFAAAPQGLIALLVSELAVGLSLGAIVRILFQAIGMAGGIISTQIGLASAVFFDPSMASQTTILSRFAVVGAATVCLALDIHHLWIEGALASYRTFPIGGLPDAGGFARLALAATQQSLLLAVSLSAPIVLYSIVFNLALGLASRMAPAIQIFFIAQPLNMLLGLALLAATAGAMFTVFADAMIGFFDAVGWR